MHFVTLAIMSFQDWAKEQSDGVFAEITGNIPDLDPAFGIGAIGPGSESLLG